MEPFVVINVCLFHSNIRFRGQSPAGLPPMLNCRKHIILSFLSFAVSLFTLMFVLLMVICFTGPARSQLAGSSAH